MKFLSQLGLTAGGLFVGYLVGFALTFILGLIHPHMHEAARVALMLACAFSGAYYLPRQAPREKTAGRFLTIKIQRQGKEPGQGVGYLDDGTMVVVNGGGDFLGQELRTRVLSTKQSSAGRIIFCNVIEGEKCGLASTS